MGNAVPVVGLLALGMTACTHRQQLSASGSELEVGDRVEARTAAGADVEGTIVEGPLGEYRVRVHQPRRELELTELRTISRESRGRGAVDGLLIGAVTGAIFGAVVAVAAWDEDEPPIIGPDSLEASIAINGLAWAGIGGLVGALGGAVGAATYEYAIPAGP